ncbi:MAG: hypothetical protein ACI8ZM_001317 [Crocinitomix sp.]|jgi:hypothetical protein
MNLEKLIFSIYFVIASIQLFGADDYSKYLDDILRIDSIYEHENYELLINELKNNENPLLATNIKDELIALSYFHLKNKSMAYKYIEKSILHGKRYWHVNTIYRDTEILEILKFDTTDLSLNRVKMNSYRFINADKFAFHQGIMDSLTVLKQLDQQERGQKSTEEDWNQQLETDVLNANYLEFIIDSLGKWPGFLETGKQGESAAFLIAQHSKQVDFQMKSLSLMLNELYFNNINPSHCAFLLDRISLAQNGYQYFGSQLEHTEKDGVIIYTAKKNNYNKIQMDILRTYFDMPPVDIYISNMSK